MLARAALLAILVAAIAAALLGVVAFAPRLIKGFRGH